MEKNKGIERLSDDSLDQVVGGAGFSPISDWKMVVVCNVTTYTLESYLYMRLAPDYKGRVIDYHRWRNGDTIYVSPSNRHGGFILAKANDGTMGWIETNNICG